jgi:hypothetical protein
MRMNLGGVAGVLDSLVLDIAKMTWSIAAIAPPNSVLANQVSSNTHSQVLVFLGHVLTLTPPGCG